MNEKNAYRFKMLGLVTLYNPAPQEATANILRYIHDVDTLIIWDNSPLEKDLQKQILENLTDEAKKVIWHGDGQNYCIAPAINFAWKYGDEHGFDLLLLMDQDSQWENFAGYRQTIDQLLVNGKMCAFTPYVRGNDQWEIKEEIQVIRMFINSGTVIPLQILKSLNGADEVFPLDALDYDLALRIIKRGYYSCCLTSFILNHTIGQPKRASIFHLYTPNYGAARTYSIVFSHIVNYRKNHRWMTPYERRRELKEFLFWKLVRILFAEKEKYERMKMYLKGIRDGLLFDMNKTKP